MDRREWRKRWLKREEKRVHDSQLIVSVGVLFLVLLLVALFQR